MRVFPAFLGLWLVGPIVLPRVEAHGGLDSQSQLNTEFSLPSLPQLNDMPEAWTLAEGAVLDEGRIILTHSEVDHQGSLWHNEPFDFKDSFTMEWTFRGTKFEGDSLGGIAFWFIQEDEGHNRDLFDGPSRFDGLQLLVSNLGPYSRGLLRGHLNDGTEDFSANDIHTKSFGSCLLEYQGSTVPVTVRLSYDVETSVLKLQVDNKVCFQTRKVALPQGKYKVGITADNARTSEVFELLKFQFFDGLTTRARLPNYRAMAQPQPVKKVINKATGKKEIIETSSFELAKMDVNNLQLFEKLDKLEGKVSAHDFGYLVRQLNKILAVQEENSKKLKMLFKAMEKMSTSLVKGDADKYTEYDDLIRTHVELKQYLEQQQKEREKFKREEELSMSGPHADEIIAKLTIWLIPLGLLMSIMAYYTFRIRQDIVKAKIL